MHPWIKSSLSKEQLIPFNRKTANACILAAAGSGKTRTLVHLIAHDLASGIPASSIIAFTFTEKAASELLARIHNIASTYIKEVDLSGIFIGTIHSWCLNYLSNQSDYYNFEPIDELHVDALASRLYDFLKLKETYSKPFPKGIESFLADIEVFYNEHLLFEQIPDKIRPSILKFIEIIESNRLITFGGMIRNSIDHLQQNGPVNDLISLYIDEYQDVNPAQVKLIKSMLPKNAKIIAVGDDLQCIYNWRGSDVKRILQFNSEFSNSSTFRLSTNYRSNPGIVNVSNKIAEGISLRDTKKVMKSKKNDLPITVFHWFSVVSDEDQAQLCVNIIKKLVDNGVPYNRIAILLRSVLSWGQIFVDALSKEGIPVNCPILSRGGGFINSFLLPCLAWLLDDQTPPKNEIEESEQEKRANDLWNSAQIWGVDYKSEAIFWSALNEWWDIVHQNQSSGYDVRGRLYDFLDKCNIRVSKNDSDLMVGLGISTQIIRSVEEIHRRRIKGHHRKSAKGVIKEVYYALIRNQKNFGESIPIDTSVDAVLISTVHQAKGLEWPIVILPMLIQGRFPVKLSKHGTSFSDDIAGRYGTFPEDEKRLFYVAFTRAQERVFMIDSAKNNYKRRSIFLRDLIKDNIIKESNINSLDPKVWKINKNDLKSPDPPPIYIGLSDILIYLECPYQYALRRVSSIQPSISDDLGFGKGLHELIQRRIEEGNSWTKKELQKQINQYINLPYTLEKQESILRKAIASRISNLEKLEAFSSNVEPEVSIEVPFEKGVVRGVIDGIQIADDNSVFIRDWKSTIHDDFLSRYERQLQFYSYALQLQGKDVNGADIVDVKTSDEKGKVISKSVNIDQKKIKSLIKNLEAALQGISDQKFPANSISAICQCCDMFRVCNERNKK